MSQPNYGRVFIAAPTPISRIPALMHTAGFLTLDADAQRAPRPMRALCRLTYHYLDQRAALKQEIERLVQQGLQSVSDHLAAMLKFSTPCVTLRFASSLPPVANSASYTLMNSYGEEDAPFERSFINVGDAADWLFSAAFSATPLGFDHEIDRIDVGDFCKGPSLLIVGPSLLRGSATEGAVASTTRDDTPREPITLKLDAPIVVNIPPAQIENHVHLPEPGSTEEIIERDHKDDIVRITKHPIPKEKRP